MFVSSLLPLLSGVPSSLAARPPAGVLAHLFSVASLDLAHVTLPALPPFTNNVYLTAALWIGLALVASLISIRTGISVALTEIFVGVLAGNFLHIQTTDWINFLAGFGSVLLTFLAGAEIDPASFRRHLKASLVIGAVGFCAPALAAFAVAFWGVHWHLQAAEIAGIALSTTSVAVVYAVMVETGLNRTELGKLILAACFVNDLGTVLALGVLFANYNVWLALFVFATAVVLAVLPWATRYVIRHWGGRVSEPEVKFLFLVLFGLGGLAAVAQSEAVLPAYLIGLVIAGTFMRNRVLMDRMRSTAFALLTPFYFLKAGSLVSLPVLLTATGAGLVGLFFLTKMLAKIIGIRPLTRPFGLVPRLGNYTTLLMATGLTFGSISALFGLTHGYINQTQYTVLVTVVILSAVIPTMFAQSLFRPRVEFGEVGPGVVQKPQSPLTAEERAELAELRDVTGAMDE
ncbi:MAG TPA: cation:proton antiporter [Ktedonobacterales bacterium]|nr:cation:proton antiporter [Ktedonobacterales bacterium]